MVADPDAKLYSLVFYEPGFQNCLYASMLHVDPYPNIWYHLDEEGGRYDERTIKQIIVGIID
jgi:hypothetical protein